MLESLLQTDKKPDTYKPKYLEARKEAKSLSEQLESLAEELRQVKHLQNVTEERLREEKLVSQKLAGEVDVLKDQIKHLAEGSVLVHAQRQAEIALYEQMKAASRAVPAPVEDDNGF